MPLPEAVTRCLKELTWHCNNLQEQIDALQAQQKKDALLRSELDSLKDLASETDLPGVCRDDGNELFNIVPGPAGESHVEAPKALKVAFPESMETCELLPRDKTVISKVTMNHVNERIRYLSSQSVEEFQHDDRHNLAIAKMGWLKKDPNVSESDDRKKFRNVADAWGYFFNRRLPGTKFQQFCDGFAFRTLCMAVICANTIYLGAAADWNVKNSFRRVQRLPLEEEWYVPNICFTIWFALEILLRLGSEKLEFFTGDDKYWNFLDVFLVTESVVSLAMQNNTQFVFLRILRVFRLVRIVRLVRSVLLLQKLRTMIFALLNSFSDLLWALCVVVLIIFVFSIVFNNAVAVHFDNVDLDDEASIADALALQAEFGTLYSSMVTLWSAISGGNDWMEYGQLLRKIRVGSKMGRARGEVYFVVFLFYVAFCFVGLFNVVTGVFVDSAVCTRTEDEIVKNYLDELQSATATIKTFLKNADKDGSGTLNFHEFTTHMETPMMKAYFAGLEIDPGEAKTIFALLDTDETGDINIDELVNGTMKLRGFASKLDIIALMHDHTRMSMRLDNLCDYLERILPNWTNTGKSP